MKVLAVYGTRPEYLKIKPLLLRSKGLIKSCHVKQHTDIIDFGNPDYTITLYQNCKNRLNNVFGEIFHKTEDIYKNFDAVLVQGDTATVAASAISAFNLKKKLIYLESGSGAKKSIPNEIIKAVTNYINIPIIVGGGICSPKSAHDKVQAGASFIVIGSAIEDGGNQNIKEFADAIHRS